MAAGLSRQRYGNIEVERIGNSVSNHTAKPSRTSPDMDALLSERERQVLSLAAAGHTDKEIARELDISTSTVTTYWARIRSKMGARGRTELVAQAVVAEVQRSIQSTGFEHERLERELVRRSRSEQELRTTCGLMKSVMDLAPYGIVIVDHTSKLLLANPRAIELLGLPEDLRQDRHLATTPEEFAKLISIASASQGAFETDLILRIAGGVIRRMPVKVIAYRAPGGHVVGCAIWITAPPSRDTRAAALMREQEQIAPRGRSGLPAWSDPGDECE